MVASRKDDLYLSDDIFNDLMINTKEYPCLSKEDTIDLVEKSNSGDRDALDLLIKSNIRLIVSVARQYFKRIYNMQMIDLVQEGIIGFMHAVQKYNKDLGQLSTYAVYWIEQAIGRAIENKEDSIRKANKFIEFNNKYYRIKENCIKKGMEMPSDEEMCKILGISKESLNLIKTSSNFMPVSINEPTEDEKSELGNIIASPNEVYDDIVRDYDNQRFLVVIKEILPPAQYYIVYYHILNPEKTLDCISKDLGISIIRTNKLEKKAFRIIKPYILENSILFNKIISNLKKQKIRLEDINVLPINPVDIVKYLYIEKDLSKEERKLLYLQLFGKFKYNKKIAIHNLGCSIDDLVKIEESLKTKIKNKFSNIERFHVYLNIMLQTYKTRIFDLIGENLDFQVDKEQLSCDEVKALINSSDIKINVRDEELLLRYFNALKNGGCSSYEIEKDVYLAVFGLKQVSEIPLTKLYDTFIVNKEKFNREQVLFLECVFFHKKNIKIFSEEFPKSKLIHNYRFLITKLETLYYGINKLFDNSMTKENYLIVKEKFGKRLTTRRIMLLDLYYGIEKEALSISEIAVLLNEDYEKLRGEIYSAIDYLENLYNNNYKGRNIDAKLYVTYLEDTKYTFTEDVRKVLHLYLEEELSYEEIAQNLNISRSKVTNLIDEGLRKIDFYRFGIIKTTKIEVKVLEDFLASEYCNFSILEKRIVFAKKGQLKTYEEISEEFNITKPKIDRIINKFNVLYQMFLVQDVKLSDKDILKEIDSVEFESVINSIDKKILSLLYGFKNVFNMEGLKLNQKEIAEYIGYSECAIGDRVRNALNNIKGRMIGLIKPELLYIEKDKMEKLLEDKHLPVSKEQREIICYLYGLCHYKEKSLDEIAELLNSNAKNIKRIYQRAVVNIYKYINKEIEGILDFEEDIEPNLKYFSKRDVLFILESFKNNLTNEEIASKYHLSIHSVNKALQRIKNKLMSLVKKEAFKFDFEFYREVINNPELPYYGNLELAKQCFELYMGESTLENLSIPQISEQLNLSCSTETIRRHIILLILSIYKYQNGIRKHITFSYEEINNYYIQNKNTMVESQRQDYIRYLNKLNSRSEFTESEENISDTIMFDLLKSRNPDFFNVDSVSKEEVGNIINEYYNKLNPSVRTSLIAKFGLNERDFMKESELQKVLRLVRKLEESTKLSN